MKAQNSVIFIGRSNNKKNGDSRVCGQPSEFDHRLLVAKGEKNGLRTLYTVKSLVPTSTLGAS